MNYPLFICADGLPAAEELAVLQRECPIWAAEMSGRGVRLLGRELDLPETAATVRVRAGEVLVSDGPFAETKEFVAGFDLVECADLDEAIEVAAKHPSSWFQSIEVRPFTAGAQLGAGASAFGRGEDGAATPYLLSVWMGGTPAGSLDALAVWDGSEAWRKELQERGLDILGGVLGGRKTATAVRVRDGRTLLGDGPVTAGEDWIAGIEVVSCRDQEEAIALAAAHPIARHYAIEVRPFWSE